MLIKRILFACFLLIPVLLSAQSGFDPSNNLVIKYDRKLKMADVKIPFDRRFVLETELEGNLKGVSAALFETEFIDGKWELRSDRLGISNGAGILTTGIEKEKLKIFVPPVGPSRTFAIRLTRPLTGKNLENALKQVIKLDAALPAAPAVPVVTDTTPAMNKEVRDLVESFNEIPAYLSNVPDAWNFYTQYANPVRATFPALRRVAPAITTLTAAELSVIDNALRQWDTLFNEIGFLKRVLTQGVEKDIYDGYLPWDFDVTTEKADVLDIDKRITNLEKSLAIYKRLSMACDKESINNAALAAVNVSLNKLIGELNVNLKRLKDIHEKILTTLNGLQESYWLASTTSAADLQTKGASMFTLDAGFTNILARDNRNNWAYIPKVYWGVNIYFRATDKNIKRNELPRRKHLQSSAARRLLGHRSPFHHLCLTLGMTFGSMSNSQFDNFYNNAALMTGISYRFARAYRIGAGSTLLRRVQDNPIKTGKSITAGAYVSLSIDIDVLKTLDKITGLIFK